MSNRVLTELVCLPFFKGKVREKNFTICDVGGTWQEDVDPTTKETICICMPHREGQYCNMSVDACKARVQHPFLPNGGLEEAGNVACNVNYEGNICESFTSESGSVHYKCTCNGITWDKDSKMNYDNCLKRRTMCDSIVCVYGQCVSNEIGTEVKCVCERGYSGYMCSEWVGIWSEWSPWDKCRPACGKVRLSVRTHDCISMVNDSSDQKPCLGASVEYSTCVEHPCSNYGGTFISTYFSFRQNSITAAIAGAAVACSFMTVMWLMFMWNAVAKPFSDILHEMLRRRNHQ
ncbi:unnamed protein product [Calicophoron daubneyi]|uniref:EGF-like domain-containing protein n=1 Tax=Calicophoron daubneyi TaxID=300641 RepID=A0AAV2T579_CALDB